MISFPIGVLGDLAGGPVISTQFNYRVNGLPVVRLADPVTPHGDSPHDAALMVGNSPSYRIDGIPACKQTDLASCGDALISSQPSYRISL